MIEAWYCHCQTGQCPRRGPDGQLGPDSPRSSDLRQIEVPLVEGRNSALVDLFDLVHAKKVLTALGTALGTLPERAADVTRQQTSFLDQAVAEMGRDGRVVCAHLAMFVEMMKARPWTLQSLKQIGGTEGLGVTFLEQAFSAATAPHSHRVHQHAAIEVLKALMPESGHDLKGSYRSYEELRAAARYQHRPTDFDELLSILDGQLRLITPVVMTDAEDGTEEGMSPPPAESDTQRCKLTHDYLVAPLREWLALKQRETRRGRAAFRLAERAAFWNAKPENRHLPAWWEFLEAQVLTRKKQWTAPQRNMMRAARGYYAARGFLIVMVLAVAIWGLREGHGRLRAKALVQNLTTAETGEVMSIVPELAKYDRWATPILHRLVGELPSDSKARLHVSLALVSTDARQVDYLCPRIRNATAAELPVIVAALVRHERPLAKRFWTVLLDAEANADERLRTACALAAFDPANPRWKDVGPFLAAKLLTENPLALVRWVDALRPVSSFLLPPFADVIAGDSSTDPMVVAACDIFSEFASGRPERFETLLQRLAISTSGGPVGSDKPPLSPLRQANVAAALMRMGQYRGMRHLLVHTDDPTVRSYLVHRVRWLRIDPELILRELARESDVSVRRALILGLGDFGTGHFTPAQRDRASSLVLQWYRDDPDPGVHSAAEWVLMRCWRQSDEAKVAIKELVTGKTEGNRSWYVTRELHTMAVIRGPFECLAGQPPKAVRVPRGFAMATKEVTVEQFLHFRKDHPYRKSITPEVNCPVGKVRWYDAAAYCNWLSLCEGIPRDEWCYEPNSEQRFAQGMKIHFGRRGYRLPTGWEWEHACRAGATTDYSWGTKVDIVAKFAWSSAAPRGRSWSVGTLKPNDLGLFDMHGNIWEWCQSRWEPRADRNLIKSTQAEKNAAVEHVEDPTLRDVWGGAFTQSPIMIGLADCAGIEPGNGGDILGFRVARSWDKEAAAGP